mgnify:CR=1 FL=1
MNRKQIIETAIRKITFGKKALTELELPFNIVDKEIFQLEHLMKDIFINIHAKRLINNKDLRELNKAYQLAKKAHDKTGAIRKGSGRPYIHHPLAVTVYAMHLAELMNFKDINLKHLLLGALYHDTIEDTRIFNTKDSGKQFSKFARKYGSRFGIVLYYVTKIPLNIDPILKKLENHIKRVHLVIFENDFVPLEARIIKIADRMMNLADTQHYTHEKIVKTVYFTEKHFQPVLKYMPANILSIFWSHLTHIKRAYNITEEDLHNYQENLKLSESFELAGEE